MDVSELEGGHAGAEVYRIDLQFGLPNGASQSVPVVLKHARESEVAAMRALREVQGADALPLTIAWGERAPIPGGASTHWFVTPLYEGEHLTFEDEVPCVVIQSLARVHARFISRLDQLGWLRRLDSDPKRSLFVLTAHKL